MALVPGILFAEEPPFRPALGAFADAFIRDSVATLRPFASTPLASPVSWYDLNDILDSQDCFSISRYEWSVVEQDADRATVDVLLHATALAAGVPRGDAVVPARWRVGLVREGNVWKLASAETLERALASAYLAKPGANEWQRILERPDVDSDRVLLQVAILNSERAHEKRQEIAAWALAEARATGHPALVARVLEHAGLAENNSGNVPGGTERFEESLRIGMEMGDVDIIAQAHVRLGINHWLSGDIPAALKSLGDANALLDQLRDPRVGVRPLHLIGTIQEQNGNFQAAINAAERTLSEGKRFGWAAALCFPHFTLASVHGQLGNIELGMDSDRETLRCSEERGHHGTAASALYNLAISTLALDPRADVVPMLRRAIGLAEGWVGADARALMHVFLGERLSPAAEAEREFLIGQSLAEEGGDSRTLIRILLALSQLRLANGRFQEALDLATRAKETAENPSSGVHKTTSGTIRFAPIFVAQGKALRAMGKAAEAEACFRRAVSLIEEERTTLPAHGMLLSNFFEQNVEAYRGLSDVLLDANRVDEAIAIHDAMKARALRDLLARGEVDLASRMTAEQRANEERLETELERLNALVMASTAGGQRQEAEQKRDAARLALERFQTELALRQPNLRARAAMRDDHPLQSAAVLESELILDYMVAEDRTTLFIIRRGKAEAHPIPGGRADLQRRVEQLLARVAARDFRYVREAEDLYRLLLGPAVQSIAGHTAICIIPDGPLWNLPFQILRAPSGRYLIEQTAVYYAPSLGALQSVHRSRSHAARTVLAIGNPKLAHATEKRVRSIHRNAILGDLPDAAAEAIAIGRMYDKGSKVLTGSGAREDVAKNEARQYDVLHFATHAIADDRRPMYSGMVLAAGEDEREDGILEARELLRLDLRADLVVVAGCSSGTGSVREGEGLVGLSWAFLVAGCPRTIVTRWPVDSKATKTLMVDFHRRLRGGERVATALRNAQLRMMRDPRYSHPIDWAPFFSLGAP